MPGTLPTRDFVNVFHGLDEMGLSKNEVDVFGFFDFDGLDFHGFFSCWINEKAASLFYYDFTAFAQIKKRHPKWMSFLLLQNCRAR